MGHPKELREKVLKFVSKNPYLASRAIGKKFNISHHAVNLWLAKCEEMPVRTKNRSHKDTKWTVKQKFDAVFKFENLSEDDQGIYLREHGIYLEQIKRWKDEMLKGLSHEKPATKKEMKMLKKELNEKKHLLELQKKVQHLLKDEE